MSILNLKLTHKPIKTYYQVLDESQTLGVVHETALKAAFQDLLVSCGQQFESRIGAIVANPQLAPDWSLELGINEICRRLSNR